MAAEGPDRDAEERRLALANGALAEELVAERLVADGWEVVARNWRGSGGELDVVVARLGRLRFVEVKARSPDDPVGLDAIGTNKQRRLVRAARAFLASWPDLVDEACFMVALVHLPLGSHSLSDIVPDSVRVDWIDNAFDA